ncbi:hypothetical protein QE152_g31174 [Popillia japonica]|uniref:Uncharacterized protein n=1 Tax=Popillia japonica TaxID=7064 RepID=A0AAW1JCJ9_POPJA
MKKEKIRIPKWGNILINTIVRKNGICHPKEPFTYPDKKGIKANPKVWSLPKTEQKNLALLSDVGQPRGRDNSLRSGFSEFSGQIVSTYFRQHWQFTADSRHFGEELAFETMEGEELRVAANEEDKTPANTEEMDKTLTARSGTTSQGKIKDKHYRLFEKKYKRG